jgi:hypothetical protein
MKGHVDLLGPKQRCLIGTSFETLIILNYLQKKKKWLAIEKAFLMVAGSAVQKFGANLDEHQQLLMAASDMLIEIYNYILRTEKLAKNQGEDKVQEQIAMAKLYLYQAVDIVTQKEKKALFLLWKVMNNA